MNRMEEEFYILFCESPIQTNKVDEVIIMSPVLLQSKVIELILLKVYMFQ